LNTIDPTKLESAWFQPLNLSSDFQVSKFAFNFNLYHHYASTKERPANDPTQTDETERKSVLFSLRQSGQACQRSFPGLSDPAVGLRTS
jgi:hypothetical protein